MTALLDSQRAGIVALRKEAYRIADEIDGAYEAITVDPGNRAERAELERLGVPFSGPADVADLDGVERAGERWHGMNGDPAAWRLADDARALRRWIEGAD